MPPSVQLARVDDIPVLVAHPDETVAHGRMALWMHFSDLSTRSPAIAFELGGNDLHINGGNAVAFKAALAAVQPAAAAQVDSRIHPGLDHIAAGRDQKVQDACFDWLLS
jgi:hypothetical protein